jgi:UDP-glucose 4-epimerase
MNFLLIGGNGFIGSHLIDLLLFNDHNVRVFDVQHEKFRAPNTNVDYRIFPFNDIASLENALLDIDIVIHLASATVPSNSNAKAILEIDNILKPSLILFQLLVKYKIKRIVYFSSGGAVYGNVDNDCLITEETQFNPVSSYGIIKTTTEHYLKLFQNNFGLNTLIIRPSNPYGPRQNNTVSQGVISNFLRKIVNGDDLIIYGNLDIKKDYIYIDDLVMITYLLISSEINGSFNVGSGIGTTLKDILSIVSKFNNGNSRCIIESSLSSDINSFVLDISNSHKITNYLPKIELYEGITLTWKWILENN